MGKGILMWLVGIPIPIIILLLLFWHEVVTRGGDKQAPPLLLHRSKNLIPTA